MSTNDRILKSQKEIISTFLNLMTKKTFDEITTTDMIHRSGYCRGTFYAHYKDKYDLKERIMENEINRFVEIIVDTIKLKKRIPIEPSMYEPAYQLFLHVNNNRNLYKLILKSRIPGHTFDSFADAINKRFKEEVDVELNKWPKRLDRDFYFYVNTHTFLTYIKYWETHNFAQSAEFMAEQVTYMLNRGKAKFVFCK